MVWRQLNLGSTQKPWIFSFFGSLNGLGWFEFQNNAYKGGSTASIANLFF